jgi:hypothetical protein
MKKPIKIKFRYDNHINGQSGYQLSTPLISIYWERNCCISFGLIIGEFQIWIGRELDDLI